LKYVIIADLHVTIKGYSRSVNGIPEHIYYPTLNLHNAVDYAKENNATLIIAGDLIDTKDSVHQMVYNYLKDELEYAKNTVETYIVAGNHDYTVYNDQMFSFLKYVGIPVAFSGNPITINDCVLIGHHWDKEKIKEDFQNIDLETTRLIVSHFGLKEALAGNTSYKGGEFSISDFSEMKDTFLILGHYHKPQKVSDNIYYVGSPNPVRVDERDDEKRFILVDTDAMTIKSIPTIYPKYKTINLDKETELDLDEIKEDIVNNLSNYVFMIPDNYSKKIEIKELQKEFSGYVFTYDVEKNDKNEELIDDEEMVTLSKININSIQEEFLEKSGVPKNDYQKYIDVINQII